MKNVTKSSDSLRIIISGGGTGGHIFPAIAIANAIKIVKPHAHILFVGALGRMEMNMIPKAGYEIIGLPIQGFNRSSMLKNVALPYKLFSSVCKAISIIKDFKPDIAIGVGGYASGPMLLAAKIKGIPYLLQEQNSFAGFTNRWLGKGAQKICVAFEGMEQFFPKDKILITGNPIRKEVTQDLEGKKTVALQHFGLRADKKTLLITGGSLGARTLNEAVIHHLQTLLTSDVQLIWQTGKLYYDAIVSQYPSKINTHIKILPFLDRMDLAYAAADIIVSRAGAGTIAELCMVGKPTVLVPSPNVAEDHQTNNAKALLNKHAALMVTDAQAKETLLPKVLALLQDQNLCTELMKNIKLLSVADADDKIAEEVIHLVR